MEVSTKRWNGPILYLACGHCQGRGHFFHKGECHACRGRRFIRAPKWAIELALRELYV